LFSLLKKSKTQGNSANLGWKSHGVAELIMLFTFFETEKKNYKRDENII